jgi:putative endonuclease
MRTTEQRRLAQRQGLAAELHVAERLAADGWVLLEHGWRCPAGEIDLIVRRGGALRFVEVKARAPGDSCPMEAVDSSKRRRLVRAAQAFLDDYRPAWDEAAFMVVSVELDDGGWNLEILDDAFDAC